MISKSWQREPAERPPSGGGTASETAQRKLFGADGAKGRGTRGTPCAFPV